MVARAAPTLVFPAGRVHAGMGPSYHGHVRTAEVQKRLGPGGHAETGGGEVTDETHGRMRNQDLRARLLRRRMTTAAVQPEAASSRLLRIISRQRD
jgi:hypothetical protein